MFNEMCHVCGQPGADEVDHVIPLARGGADTIANMRPIHAEPCHREKTAREAAVGRRRLPRKRPPEPHPGLLP
jgi:5-methylcytosine-specific restriction enzyme A